MHRNACENIRRCQSSNTNEGLRTNVDAAATSSDVMSRELVPSAITNVRVPLQRKQAEPLFNMLVDLRRQPRQAIIEIAVEYT